MQIKSEREQLIEKLKLWLSDMDIPELRKNDLRWLNRNLAIRNQNNKNFLDAIQAIKLLLIVGLTEI